MSKFRMAKKSIKKTLAENVITRQSIETRRKLSNNKINQVEKDEGLCREFPQTDWPRNVLHTLEPNWRPEFLYLLCNLTEQTSDHIINCNNLAAFEKRFDEAEP